jgi:two-component sensor histidine kinase
LSVSSDGPGLPQGFDPAARKGLGMKIIRSLVKRIGGELRIGQGDQNQGARFTVLSPDRSQMATAVEKVHRRTY